MAPGMSDADYRDLNERVAKGIQWLVDNDERSRFHIWFGAGLTPVSPMPAHEGTPEVRSAYDVYYRARVLWERLMSRLEAEDRRRGADVRPAIFIEFWSPKDQVRGHA